MVLAVPVSGRSRSTESGSATGQSSVRIRLPDWVWGGRPAGLIAAAGWRGIEGVDGFDVRTEESYLRRSRPLLVDDALVLGSDLRPGGGFACLESLADDELEAPVRQRLNERFDLASRPNISSLPSFAKRVQEDLSLWDRNDLPHACTNVLEAIQSLTITETGEQLFPGGEVFSLRRSARLLHRAKTVSVLVRLKHDERLARGDIAGALGQLGAGENVFASSAALSDGVFLLEPYVGPLLACLSPAVWAFPVHRVHGTIIFSFGRPVAGAASQPEGLLRVLRTVGADPDVRQTYVPFESSRTPALAIAWWAGRLDQLFGVLTDPVVFADEAGDFDPTAALQMQLSVEQVFRRTNSLLLADHDTHARRAVFFTVMDTLQTLLAINLEQLFDHDHAARTLERLEASIPSEAHEVLLSAARRGVGALRQVQDGFFLRDDQDMVRLVLDRPPVSLSTAAAAYVGMLRNATHGFTTTRASARQKVATLLAVHNGNVHHDLGLLAWLYVLDLLDRPAHVRAVMSDHRWRH
jgi:hypothetical protein